MSFLYFDWKPTAWFGCFYFLNQHIHQIPVQWIWNSMLSKFCLIRKVRSKSFAEQFIITLSYYKVRCGGNRTCFPESTIKFLSSWFQDCFSLGKSQVSELRFMITLSRYNSFEWKMYGFISDKKSIKIECFIKFLMIPMLKSFICFVRTGCLNNTLTIS